MPQTTSTVLMIRPSHFGYNEETSSDNRFQQIPHGPEPDIAEEARRRFDTAVGILRKAGIRVLVMEEQEGALTPDCIFPNNWVSFHADGTVVLYPMASPSRRRERRDDLIPFLRSSGFEVGRVLDLSHCESRNQALEGTGSLVLDHLNRLAYASVSPRTNPDLVIEWAQQMGFEPVIFHSGQHDGDQYYPVYHTNVILSVGEHFAVLAAEMIESAEERAVVLESLENTGRVVITISEAQVHEFAGNVLELRDQEGNPKLVLSERAHRAFSTEQIEKLSHHAELIVLPLGIIETVGGGSARCMIAEVFLPIFAQPTLTG